MEEPHWELGDDVRYAYAVGVVRALETRLLSRERIERAADAPTIEEVLRILAETTYAEYLSALEGAEDHESFLEKEHERVLSLLQTLTKDPPLTDLFFHRFDFHNLKVAVKERFSDQNLASAYAPFGLIAVPVVQAAVTEEDFSSLPPWLAPVAERVVRDFREKQDPKRIDDVVDRCMYERFIETSRAEGNLFLYGLVQREIDLINILSLFRIRHAGQGKGDFREAFVEGGTLSYPFYLNLFDEPVETLSGRFTHTPYRALVENGWDHLNSHGSFVVFERMGRDFMLEYLRQANLIAFGVEPLIAYVHAKENELRMIRTIMVGKLNNVPAPVIKESLPRVYL